MDHTVAEKEGFAAFDAGFSIWDNPYEVSNPLWLEWRDGWLDADYIEFDHQNKQ